METDGGGWTVFQRRIDANVSFYDRTWNEYKVGFNNGLDKNLWLGNDIIHVLSTKDSNVELRIDIWGDRAPYSSRPNGYWWEKHTNFFIDNEANFYTLHISSLYTGNASIDSTYNMYFTNNWRFSTFDRNNGAASVCFPSGTGLGGWWHSSNFCAVDALNGQYISSRGTSYGFRWLIDQIQGYIKPKQSRMMLRRIL
uniref:Fibrinogen C-terminal domain-containing protein n=1 Tax=Plectus sambesii TaxID=2011161 RepID=A0A914UU63_9BILA